MDCGDGLAVVVTLGTLLTAFTDVFSEYDTAGATVVVGGRGVGELLSTTAACSGDASKGDTLATGFWTLVAAGGEDVVGLEGSSTGAGAGAGAGAGVVIVVLLEKRLAHDLPGAGCGCG